ncbi:MAG: class I SAM-dependent methyltransferase [Muribaculaceae bacterium]|nr:class I SAM-dependent methyltransferase [Muribaculaceae bacterium]
MDDKSFFDKIAVDWDANEVLSTAEKVREILGQMELKKGQRVLDLGTGTGVLIPFIAEKIGEKGEIMAVDFSEEMLKRAKEKFGNIIPSLLFLNLDFENETIPGEFDRIILYCVYPHLNTPVETLKWLKTVNLKPDGKIFIAFPCDNNFINNIHRERLSQSDSLPSPSQLVAFLKDQGLHAEVVADTPESYIVSIK